MFIFKKCAFGLRLKIICNYTVNICSKRSQIIPTMIWGGKNQGKVVKKKEIQRNTAESVC